AALIAALQRAIDSVADHIQRDDADMGAVFAEVVRRLLAHPLAAELGEDLCWRRQLTRWSKLVAQLGPMPIGYVDVADIVDHFVRVRLDEGATAARIGMSAW